MEPANAVLIERFLDAAKALGVKESDEAFHEALRALWTLKPEPKQGT